ncbi:MAG: glycosyltransferase family 2 protein [Holophagales bacterium]|jgi:GT2 family glycosyltransferase|nr:glycosyltransferase family 2 protein [Holophagales bacterium]
MNPETTLSHDAPPWVILVNYRDKGLTSRCLESLAKVESCPHAAIVVDHGPDLAPLEYWRQFHPNVHSLQDASNPGFASGCNRGAEYALAHGAGSLWFLNNDATLIEPTLARLLKLAQDYPLVSLWGTYQQDGDRLIGCSTHKGWFVRASRGRSRNIQAIEKMGVGGELELLESNQSLSGASIFLSKDAWEKLGPWPEKYFLYWEDAAWCLRTHRLGMLMAMVNLRIVHAGSATTVRRSPLPTFYGARNQLLLHMEAMPDARFERLLLKCHMLQKCIFRGRWGLVAPTWRGIVAASRRQGGRDPRY